MRLLLTVLTFIASHFSLYAQYCEHLQEDVTRYYLNPKDIRLSENGIYLCVEGGDAVALQNIQSDHNGLYTVAPQAPVDEQRYFTFICPGCKGVYYCWQSCSTPNCSWNPRNRPRQ